MCGVWKRETCENDVDGCYYGFIDNVLGGNRNSFTGVRYDIWNEYLKRICAGSVYRLFSSST